MNKQIFLNVAVADLPRSMAFNKAPGYSHNPQFTDDTAAGVVIRETISDIRLTQSKFRQFNVGRIFKS